PVIRAVCCVSVIGMTPSRSRVRIDRIDLDLVYYTLHMSMGKRVRERQPEMWVATTNFPTPAGHPFYTAGGPDYRATLLSKPSPPDVRTTQPSPDCGECSAAFPQTAGNFEC